MGRTKQVEIRWRVQAEGTMRIVVDYDVSKEEVSNIASDVMGKGISFGAMLLAGPIQINATTEVISADEITQPSPLSKLTIVGNPNNKSPG